MAIAGLKSNLKDELAKQGDFDSLAELVIFVVPLNNRLRRRNKERKKEDGPLTTSASYAGTLAKPCYEDRSSTRPTDSRPSPVPPRPQPNFGATRFEPRHDAPRIADPLVPSPMLRRIDVVA